jgi:flagellar biosynthesis/type III secretory pathway chaperone
MMRKRKNEEIERLIEHRDKLRDELERLEQSRKIAREYLLLKNLQVLNFRFNKVSGHLEGIEMRVRGSRRQKDDG